MKVSFRNLSIQPSLKGEPVVKDLTEDVANAVYQEANTFEQHKLAHRIAESGDEIELTAEEAEWVKRAVGGFRFFAQKPILEALGEKFD